MFTKNSSSLLHTENAVSSHLQNISLWPVVTLKSLLKTTELLKHYRGQTNALINRKGG
jgi:hypothetical protein